MNLDDWLARIEQLHPAGIELGLARVGQVANALGVLPLPGKTVVVAGTNGKGSTVTLLEQLARASGCSTSLYTSPHLLRFNERIRFDGVPVADPDLLRAFESVDAARGAVPLTYFEFTTLAALWLCRQQHADLNILEVGLGGRLDAVNLVDADVAIITSIGLDHTDWLGDSLDQIACEKAGIRRPGKPLLFAADEMPVAIDTLCHADDVPLWRRGERFGSDAAGLYWQDADGHRRQLPLTAEPALGTDNLAVAVQALALLDCLDAGQVGAVAARATMPGRNQHISVDGCDWVLDIGHNAEALQRFCARLPDIAGRTYAVTAMLADKPAARALEPFVSTVQHWYLAGLEGERGQSAMALRQALPASVPVDACEDVAAAVAAARAACRPGDRVLVFGSFHTVAQAATALSLALE